MYNDSNLIVFPFFACYALFTGGVDMAFTFCLYMIAFCVAFSFLVCLIITVIFIAVLLLQLLYQFPYLVWAGWTGKAISCPVRFLSHILPFQDM